MLTQTELEWELGVSWFLREWGALWITLNHRAGWTHFKQRAEVGTEHGEVSKYAQECLVTGESLKDSGWVSIVAKEQFSAAGPGTCSVFSLTCRGTEAPGEGPPDSGLLQKWAGYPSSLPPSSVLRLRVWNLAVFPSDNPEQASLTFIWLPWSPGVNASICLLPCYTPICGCDGLL